MKKLFTCALCLLLAALPLTACGNSGADSTDSPNSVENAGDTENQDAEPTQASGDPVTITWIGQGPGENLWEGKTRPMLDQYEQETGVKIAGEFYSFADLLEVIEVKIASGSTDYDVISVDVPLVAAYANRGYLKDVEDYFTAEEKTQFIDSALEAGSWQGTFYCPPMNTSSQLLWYNIDLLNEAGVTVPENSVEKRLTWEQVLEMIDQTLDVIDPDRNQGINGIMFQQISRTYQMCAIPNSLGEPSIGSDGFTVDGVINSDGWIKAMSWYQDLYNNGQALRGVTATEANEYFNSGKTIFMIGGTWTPSLIGDTNFGYAPCPAFAGYEDQVATPTGSWHFGINAASEHPDEAGAFVKWFSLGEGNTMFLETFNDVPATKAAVEAITTDPGVEEFMKIAAYEAANTAVPRALSPGYNEYSSVLDATFEDIRNGTDVKTALDNAVSQINTQFERYR